MSVSALKEDIPFGAAHSFEPGEKNEEDAERQRSYSRRYSRIGPAIGAGTDSEKADIGHQIELEAHAAIKYRTCSWQKVGFFVDKTVEA